MKKMFFVFVGILVITSIISAESINVEFPNGNQFESGQPILFKATLSDDSESPTNGQITVEIRDSSKRILYQKTINSREVISADLGEKASAGQGVLTATHGETESINFFDIGEKELARFDLDGDTLKVTNIGNTEYSRVIKITIGETTGTKEPTLEIGESTTYRLVAPEGNYDIKVTDGLTSLTRGGIKLSGTGQAIGALDDSTSRRSPVTGGISPDGSSDIALLSYLKNNSFVYVFMLVIFGAAILVAVERNYRKKASTKRK